MNSFYLYLILIVFGVSSSYGSDYDECSEGDDRFCELHDLNCIRNFLASNSKCKKVKGQVRDCATLPRSTFELPVINSTVILRRPEMSGFRSARIVAFYQNTTSSNLVIAFQMKNARKDYRDSSVFIHRRAQEPIRIDDNYSLEIRLITFTAIIPSVPRLDLRSATVYAHFDSPDIEVIQFKDPSQYDDPTIRNTMSTLLDELITAAKEAMSSEGRQIVQYYIQSSLCDFGIHS